MISPNILVFTYALNGFLMIAMPVGLAIILTRRWRLASRIWWIGALTFIFSQIGHIPFNALVTPVFNRFGFIALHPTAQLIVRGIFIGLSAGLFEEGARYLILRFWLKEARSWRTGILFGAGHGGAEAILFGAIVLFGYIQLLILRTATPEQLAQVVGQANVELAQIQLTAAWSVPWHETLLPAFERLATIIIQISLAVLVLQTFVRGQWFWICLAVLYHASIDFFAVLYAFGNIDKFTTEAIAGGFAILSLVIIFLLRRPDPIAPNSELAPAPVQTPVLKPLEETNENLDNTRYQ